MLLAFLVLSLSFSLSLFLFIMMFIVIYLFVRDDSLTSYKFTTKTKRLPNMLITTEEAVPDV